MNQILFYSLYTAGQPCMAYDVAINSTFFAKVEGSPLFQTFLVTIAIEGLEDKYKMELDKNGMVYLCVHQIKCSSNLSIIVFQVGTF